MPTNKHAVIRYQVLDRCFSNRYRQFFIEDLIEACNDALFEFDPDCSGVQRRQVFNDIAYMRSDQGWSAPIETYQYGKRKYYRYSDPEFSITRQPLSSAELDGLKEIVQTLRRFRGLPGNDWIEEFVTNLEDKFNLKGNAENVIGFESNPYLSGIERLSDIFNYIINRQPVRVRYTPFGKEERVWDIHPYYLKQYNNRWFLLGLEEGYGNLTNIPLDRIADISPVHITFRPNETVDFDEYFDDVVGVTIPKGREPEDVLLRFAPERFPYILSKPIHPSQRTVDREKGIVGLTVIPNKELEALVLSYGEQVEVLAPAEFRKRISGKIEDSYKKYFAVHKDCTTESHLCSVD